jgi:hypothetical protein
LVWQQVRCIVVDQRHRTSPKALDLLHFRSDESNLVAHPISLHAGPGAPVTDVARSSRAALCTNRDRPGGHPCGQAADSAIRVQAAAAASLCCRIRLCLHSTSRAGACGTQGQGQRVRCVSRC